MRGGLRRAAVGGRAPVPSRGGSGGVGGANIATFWAKRPRPAPPSASAARINTYRNLCMAVASAMRNGQWRRRGRLVGDPSMPLCPTSPPPRKHDLCMVAYGVPRRLLYSCAMFIETSRLRPPFTESAAWLTLHMFLRWPCNDSRAASDPLSANPQQSEQRDRARTPWPRSGCSAPRARR